MARKSLNTAGARDKASATAPPHGRSSGLLPATSGLKDANPAFAVKVRARRGPQVVHRPVLRNTRRGRASRHEVGHKAWAPRGAATRLGPRQRLPASHRGRRPPAAGDAPGPRSAAALASISTSARKFIARPTTINAARRRLRIANGARKLALAARAHAHAATSAKAFPCQ